MVISRFEVYLISLDPTLGFEMKKTRPCIIISPNEMNHSKLQTVIVAPMTSSLHIKLPTRIETTFSGKKGQIILDQIRTLDKARLIKKLGIISHSTKIKILAILQEMFV